MRSKSAITVCSSAPRRQTAYLSALDFCNSPVWNIEFDELDFQSISNLNFTGYSRQKNPVQTGKKIQFIKLNISNWRIANIKCR